MPMVLGLRAARTPDLSDGFLARWETKDLGERRRAVFVAAGTPFGMIGLLPGEDLLVLTVRAICLCRRRATRCCRSAACDSRPCASCRPRSATNWCAVAPYRRVAAHRRSTRSSPANLARTGSRCAFDPQLVRRARAKISPDLYDNFPLWVRDELSVAFRALLAHSRRPWPVDPRAGWVPSAQRRVAVRERRSTPDAALLDFLARAGRSQRRWRACSAPTAGARRARAERADTAIAHRRRLAAAPNAKIALFPSSASRVPVIAPCLTRLSARSTQRVRKWLAAPVGVQRIYAAAGARGRSGVPAARLQQRLPS
jgi:hypothetical protein